MKVFIVGGGSREHAIADAFARSKSLPGIVVIPGNAGIAREYDTVPLSDIQEQIQYCLDEKPDLVFIGPEQPLEQGMADVLRLHGIACIGPSQAAARIETSKIFAKELMKKHSIPTADFFQSKDKHELMGYLNKCKFPIVVKADGLAAGKGVIIAHSKAEAADAVNRLMESPAEASPKGIVLEEYLQGWEVSLFAFSDGTHFVSTLFSQDHKQLYDQDQGPNTGGMGAYAPVLEAAPWQKQIENQIISPVLKAMRDEGCPFSGVLYCGLMITDQGPKVIEFNCRFGDPEAQALLPLLKTDMLDICKAILDQQVDKLNLEWKDASCVTVVLASKGYPGSFEKGFPISIPQSSQAKVFYSGVRGNGSELQTSGGRVLCVSALGKDKEEARALAYQQLSLFSFEGMHYRKDIALRNNRL